MDPSTQTFSTSLTGQKKSPVYPEFKPQATQQDINRLVQAAQPKPQPTPVQDDDLVNRQAKYMTKAIFGHESNNDYNAVGDANTSRGAGQWQEPTWKAHAQEVLGDPNAPMTPENQSVVAQGMMRKFIKEGKNAAQIAAIWNSGSDQGWENKIGDKVINGKTIHYDVPKYVKQVTDAYQQLKMQGEQEYAAQRQSQTPQQPESPQSFGQGLVKGIGGLYNALASPLIGLAATPVQGLAKVLGQPDPFAQGVPSAFSLGGAQQTPVSKLGVKEKAGDALQAASMVAPARGIAGLALAGAGQGAGHAMSQGGSTQDIAQQGLIGAATGGTVGVAGKGLEYLSQSLPLRIAQGFIRSNNPDVAQQAVESGLGPPQKMYDQSTQALKSIGQQLGQALKGEGETYILPTGQEILSRITSLFPHSGLSEVGIARELERLVPLKRTLIHKLVKGDISAIELHELNSSLGQAVYKTTFDTPQVKAGKQVGNEAYHTISSILKEALPGSAPLFDEYSKEIALNKALEKLVRSGNKPGSPVTLKDLLYFTAGSTLHPLGGLALTAGEKALSSPAITLRAGGLLSNLNNPVLNRSLEYSRVPLVNTAVPQTSKQ